MRFVVTGTPGSGTRYTAQVLNLAGVDTGHESALHHGTSEGGFLLRQVRHDAEVSWYAAPWLHLFVFPSVHVVRHPLLTISTLLRMRKWAEGPLHQGTFRRFSPSAFDYEPGPERMARFWLDWNALAERADFRWDISALDPDEVWRLIRSVKLSGIEPADVAEAIRKTPRNVGSRTRGKQPLDWPDLGVLADETYDRAVSYGLEQG